MALFADVHEFAAESVADVHHGCRAYVEFVEACYDVAACLCLNLALYDVFLSGEVGLEVFQFLQASLVVLLLGFIHHLVIDTLLTLKELQTHVCGTEVAGNADEVGVFLRRCDRRCPPFCFSYYGDAYCKRRCREEVVSPPTMSTPPFVASHAESAVELLHVLNGEAFAQSYAHCELAWGAVHGENVAYVHHRRLVAEVLKVDVGEVEMHSFHKHIGADEHFTVGIMEHGAVVATP